MTAAGLIQIAFEGGVKEAHFQLEAESDDDVSSPKTPHHEGQSALGLTEPNVRDRLYGRLVGQIQGVAAQVLAVRAGVHLAKAKDFAAQDQAFEADHNYYVADQIARIGGGIDPQFLDWMARKYHLLHDVVTAALARSALPKWDLAKNYALKLRQVVIHEQGANNRDLRSLLMFTLTGGVTSATMPGGGAPIRGGVAALRITGFRDAGGGFRIHGGSYGTDRGFVDFEWLGGYGFWINWLNLTAIGGIGGDMSPANEDGLAPSADSFVLPIAGYVQAGARASYTFAFPGEIELMYTKVLRFSSALPRENRLDVSVLFHGLAFTGRYSEYLSHGRGGFTLFGTEDRSASTLWLLGGFGY